MTDHSDEEMDRIFRYFFHERDDGSVVSRSYALAHASYALEDEWEEDDQCVRKVNVHRFCSRRKNW
jgi:hypothetical protein